VKSEKTIYEDSIPVGDFILVERREGWVIIGIGDCGKQAYLHLHQARQMANAILAELNELMESEDK
jgi:hypothetical protein